MKIQFLVEWSQETKKTIGLPRPFAKYKKGVGRFNLPLKTPIPWQSEPDLSMGGIRLIKENEEKVYAGNLCAYCGVDFLKNEKVIRWTTLDKPLSKDGDRVFSDLHPFHLECMRQARIFCPHMKTTTDDEFELGTFEELRARADIQLALFNV